METIRDLTRQLRIPVQVKLYRVFTIKVDGEVVEDFQLECDPPRSLTTGTPITWGSLGVGEVKTCKDRTGSYERLVLSFPQRLTSRQHQINCIAKSTEVHGLDDTNRRLLQLLEERFERIVYTPFEVNEGTGDVTYITTIEELGNSYRNVPLTRAEVERLTNREAWIEF